MLFIFALYIVGALIAGLSLSAVAGWCGWGGSDIDWMLPLIVLWPFAILAGAMWLPLAAPYYAAKGLRSLLRRA